MRGKAVLAAATAVALAASLCATGCAPSPSGDFTDNSSIVESAQSGEYVIDKCGAISGPSKILLESEGKSIATVYGCGTYFVVIEDYIEAELEQYAANLWQRRGLGIGESRNGIIYVVSGTTGEYTTLLHGKAESAFSESRIAEIESAVAEELAGGDWDGGVIAYMEMCMETLQYYDAHGYPLGNPGFSA